MTMRIVPYLFTVLYLVAMFRPVTPLLSFMINQDYIAAFLCINRDKPDSKCKGKCYLVRILHEQEQKKQKDLPSIDMREYPIGFIHISRFEHNGISNKSLAESFPNPDHYKYLYSFLDFHPPIFTH